MATPKKAYYKHHQKETDSDVRASAKTREVVISTEGKKLIWKYNDGTFGELTSDTMKFAKGYASLAAAVAAIGATPGTLLISDAYTLTANITIPATLALHFVKGGSIALAGFTLNINGPLESGLHLIFSGAGTVNLAAGACTAPQAKWFGATGNGVTDDQPALLRAVNALPSTGGDLYFSDGAYLLGSSLAFGSITKPIVLHFTQKAYLTSSGAVDVDIFDQPDAGPSKIFDPLVNPIFEHDYDVIVGGCRVEFAYPHWYGAKGDGVTDDSDALVRAFTKAHNQYRGVGVNLGSWNYLYTKTLRIRKKVTGNGFRLIAGGDGTNFRYANNPYSRTTAPTGVDCTIVIQDGGSLDGGSIVVLGTTLDNVGNQGIWLVNLESNFGKNPMYNMRLDGWSAARNLNGVICRYNTTSDIGPFGGAYFLNGFEASSCGIMHFKGLFFEGFSRGGRAFYFNSVFGSRLTALWSEATANNSIGFTIQSCGTLQLENLMFGDPIGGGSALASTADAAADTITQNVTAPLENADRLLFYTVVAGLTLVDYYYVVDASAGTFKVSLTLGGAAVDITANGAVTWKPASQCALRIISSSDIVGYSLQHNGAQPPPYIQGKTMISTSSRLLLDDTFEPLSAKVAAGQYSQTNYDNERQVMVENIDISDTTVYRYIGQVPRGARITFDLTARTTGFAGTDGALNIYKSTGAGMVLVDTVTPGSGDLVGSGSAKTLTYDVTQTLLFYIAPVTPAGSGIMDCLVSWNKVSGL